ncbi:hypothetical protein BGV14_19350, partial [Clostridioides difficile]
VQHYCRGVLSFHPFSIWCIGLVLVFFGGVCYLHFFLVFSSRRRPLRSRSVSWACRCLLETVLIFIDNAFKYTKLGDEIALELKEDIEDEVTLLISDTGIDVYYTHLTQTKKA